jgi:peptidoglycan L-alanyl-D-glutamate endopeptidase CwlK
MAALHPALADKAAKVLAAMAALGFPMRICAAVRTAAEQAALYAQGRTAPGAVVTNADGYVKLSNHQPKADGYGHAVDCCFTAGPPFGDQQPWAAYGACGKALGLIWGGDWPSLRDRPHLELP